MLVSEQPEAKDTKQPKGYAFCDFDDHASVQAVDFICLCGHPPHLPEGCPRAVRKSAGAEAAIEKLNHVEYNGRKLRIDAAERELSGSQGGPRTTEAPRICRVSCQV